MSIKISHYFVRNYFGCFGKSLVSVGLLLFTGYTTVQMYEISILMIKKNKG